ncbi:hypothetical protein [Streptomyces phaeofaciens]|uniref:hypothetical protein n=1 Tax=Streptomyces phaeofaciens TaxID=68254 RepID=UPI0036A6D2B0
MTAPAVAANGLRKSYGYGGEVGVKTIGCFEIGPDPANLPADGEISEPGDSGALWPFKQGNGRPGTVMAGLHFGGEGKSDPEEHALACLSTSVFEKLEISLTPPAPSMSQPWGAAALNDEPPPS